MNRRSNRHHRRFKSVVLLWRADAGFTQLEGIHHLSARADIMAPPVGYHRRISGYHPIGGGHVDARIEQHLQCRAVQQRCLQSWAIGQQRGCDFCGHYFQRLHPGQ